MKNQTKLIAQYAKAAIQNGSAFSIKVNRPAKVLKAFEHEGLRVVSTLSCHRAKYTNKAAVKKAILEGLRQEPKLPFWAESFKVDGITFWRHRKNGTEYFPFPLFGGSSKRYLLEGKEVSFSDIEHMLLSDEKKKKLTKEQLDEKGWAAYNTPKVENIIQLV